MVGVPVVVGGGAILIGAGIGTGGVGPLDGETTSTGTGAGGRTGTLMGAVASGDWMGAITGAIGTVPFPVVGTGAETGNGTVNGTGAFAGAFTGRALGD